MQGIMAVKLQGEYLYFLDSDDWIDPETLETMLYFLNENEEASYVYSDIMLEEDEQIVKK